MAESSDGTNDTEAVEAILKLVKRSKDPYWAGFLGLLLFYILSLSMQPKLRIGLANKGSDKQIQMTQHKAMKGTETRTIHPVFSGLHSESKVHGPGWRLSHSKKYFNCSRREMSCRERQKNMKNSSEITSSVTWSRIYLYEPKRTTVTWYL